MDAIFETETKANMVSWLLMSDQWDKVQVAEKK